MYEEYRSIPYNIPSVPLYASYIPRELKEEYEKKDPVAVAERQLLAQGLLQPF